MNLVENIETEEDESQEQGERSNNLVAVRLPKEQIAFIGRNQKAGNMIGSLVSYIKDVEDLLENHKKMLLNPDTFVDELENGTKEELATFLSILNEQIESSLALRNLSDNDLEKVMEKFNESKIPSTRTVIDEGEFKDNLAHLNGKP